MHGQIFKEHRRRCQYSLPNSKSGSVSLDPIFMCTHDINWQIHIKKSYCTCIQLTCCWVYSYSHSEHRITLDLETSSELVTPKLILFMASSSDKLFLSCNLFTAFQNNHTCIYYLNMPKKVRFFSIQQQLLQNSKFNYHVIHN